MLHALGQGLAGRHAAPVAPVHRRLLPIVRSNGPEQNPDDNLAELKNKFFQPAKKGSPVPSRAQPESAPGSGPQQDNVLDNVNPYTLGRQARKALNDVWSQLSNLASPTKSYMFDETMEPSRDIDFEVPQAAYTTVLVVGATGRVGRILTRKLLLRGYKVKALVRKREGKARTEIEGIPQAVEVIEGDLGDMYSCQAAVRGVNKVIFCAAARSTLSADLTRVDERGVVNIVKALQDEFIRVTRRNAGAGASSSGTGNKSIGRNRIFSQRTKKEIADFSEEYHQRRWDVTYCGDPGDAAAVRTPDPAGTRRPTRQKWAAESSALAEITEEDNLIFSGILYGRAAYAEVGARLHARLPAGDHRTANTEAITMRVRGDGQQYACTVKTSEGHTYVARFTTRVGYLTVRLPWTSFRPTQEGLPPLNPEAITHIGIRFEARRAGVVAGKAGGTSAPRPPSALSEGEARFELEVDWIKALPSGNEPDVVLVSCAGGARSEALEPQQLARMVMAKRRGEDGLRASGLAYAIIRPGQLVDEPGGYRALVFDQSDRVSQPVSAADVADICLRALHEPAAVNKTFDVCYEMTGESSNMMYELVSSTPDKRNNYLSDAAGVLAKNT